MCRQCRQLEKNIAHCRRHGDWLTSDQQLDLLILETFKAASLVLEGTNSRGTVRSDLDQASNNLTKMYELNAPDCLIRKAHSVHGKRLRHLRASLQDDLRAKTVDSELRRKEFVLVRGDKP